jgi:hypothetical protein
MLTIFRIEVDIARCWIASDLVGLAGVLFDVSTSFPKTQKAHMRGQLTSSRHLPALKVINRSRDIVYRFVVISESDSLLFLRKLPAYLAVESFAGGRVDAKVTCAPHFRRNSHVMMISMMVH